MINITKLFCGLETPGDSLRYGEKQNGVAGSPHSAEKGNYKVVRSASERKPIIVWTMSRRCNLRCVHCYTDSKDQSYEGELSTSESKSMLEGLAKFEIPALLMSGGEPLIHPNFFELAAFARSLGIMLTLSTNGTLIDAEMAKRIHQTGFSYVGISFDGLGKINDKFRGKLGAFDAALDGVRNLKAVGQKVGLRLTLTRRNVEVLPEIFELVGREKIDRVCFYHLVYSGRGIRISEDDLTHDETRTALDKILAWTKEVKSHCLPIEVLTVDNHADGVYLYLKLLEKDPKQAEVTRRFLEWNGGGAYSSGVGIANIDSYGNVHPDQFWQTHTVGNVRERLFSQIWTDTSDPILLGLRNRLPLLKGRCGTCQWKAICGGSFRVRAFQVYGDPWAQDPACYLTDKEIS